MLIKNINHEIMWQGTLQGKPVIKVEIQPSGEEKSVDEVLKEIRRIKSCSKLIFTGLDPLLDQMEIIKIISMIQEGWEIVIRTIGGIMPDYFIRDKVDTWEVELLDEGTVVPFDYNEDAIRFFASAKNSVFEWVVRGEQDLIEIKRIIYFYQISWKKVVLRLCDEYCESKEDLNKKKKWIEELCLEKGCSMGNPLLRKW